MVYEFKVPITGAKQIKKDQNKVNDDVVLGGGCGFARSFLIFCHYKLCSQLRRYKTIWSNFSYCNYRVYVSETLSETVPTSLMDTKGVGRLCNLGNGRVGSIDPQHSILRVFMFFFDDTI